jgi:hypothetical protein
MTAKLDGRCGTCARFVRVTELIDANGEVRRAGECLLGVWSPPLFESNTCSQYRRKGTFATSPKRTPPSRGGSRESSLRAPSREPTFPEELYDMNADEFRQVLREVLRDELGVRPIDLAGRWAGGDVILRPGKEGTAEKTIPIEALFHKIVLIRDRLRVLEQKVNAHPSLSDEDKVQMQQYVTQCYGSLTTFNVLFADRQDAFVGQKGEKDD